MNQRGRHFVSRADFSRPWKSFMSIDKIYLLCTKQYFCEGPLDHFYDAHPWAKILVQRLFMLVAENRVAHIFTLIRLSNMRWKPLTKLVMLSVFLVWSFHKFLLSTELGLGTCVLFCLEVFTYFDSEIEWR